MDDIHGENSQQASSVLPCLTKVPLLFVHNLKPNLGNEHKELNPLGLFFVLVVGSFTLDLFDRFREQVIESTTYGIWNIVIWKLTLPASWGF